MREEKIEKMEKRIALLSNSLKRRYDVFALTVFLNLEKEVEIQKCYLEVENG